MFRHQVSDWKVDNFNSKIEDNYVKRVAQLWVWSMSDSIYLSTNGGNTSLETKLAQWIDSFESNMQNVNL